MHHVAWSRSLKGKQKWSIKFRSGGVDLGFLGWFNIDLIIVIVIFIYVYRCFTIIIIINYYSRNK